MCLEMIDLTLEDYLILILKNIAKLSKEAGSTKSKKPGPNGNPKMESFGVITNLAFRMTIFFGETPNFHVMVRKLFFWHQKVFEEEDIGCPDRKLIKRSVFFLGSCVTASKLFKFKEGPLQSLAWISALIDCSVGFMKMRTVDYKNLGKAVDVLNRSILMDSECCDLIQNSHVSCLKQSYTPEGQLQVKYILQ